MNPTEPEITKRKRGRPKLVRDDKPVTVRLSAAHVAKIDKVAAQNETKRSAALRTIIDQHGDAK